MIVGKTIVAKTKPTFEASFKEPKTKFEPSLVKFKMPAKNSLAPSKIPRPKPVFKMISPKKIWSKRPEITVLQLIFFSILAH